MDQNSQSSQNPNSSESLGSASSGIQPEPVKKLQPWRWFWLTFLVVSLAYAWYCFYVPSNDIAWADTFDSAQKQAREVGKPMILYFTGQWSQNQPSSKSRPRPVDPVGAEALRLAKTPRARSGRATDLFSKPEHAETATVDARKPERSVPKIKPDRPTCRRV